MNIEYQPNQDLDPQETAEWIESLRAVTDVRGPARARFLLDQLIDAGQRMRAAPRAQFTTPYVNTISLEDQPAYPGDRELERRIKGLVRWNAMAMVVRGIRNSKG